MKIILILMISISCLTYTRAQQDTSGVKEKEMKIQNQIQKKEMKQINKSIGPKDNLGKGQASKLKGKDVFIDKDGDGICDTRQSGMSFNKLRKRQGKQGGTGGGGGGKGNGGNQNGNG